MAIETEINAIASVHNIGALSLETLPLKTSLKSEAASWKAQFAHNLHKQCSEDLKAFDAYIRDTTLKVRRQNKKASLQVLDSGQFVLMGIQECKAYAFHVISSCLLLI